MSVDSDGDAHGSKSQRALQSDDAHASKSQRASQPGPRPVEPKPPIPVATVTPAPMNIPIRPPPPSQYNIMPVSNSLILSLSN